MLDYPVKINIRTTKTDWELFLEKLDGRPVSHQIRKLIHEFVHDGGIKPIRKELFDVMWDKLSYTAQKEIMKKYAMKMNLLKEDLK